MAYTCFQAWQFGRRRLGLPVLLVLAFSGVALAAGESGGFDLRLSGLAKARLDMAYASVPLSLALLVVTLYAAAISVLHVRNRKLWSDHFEEQNRALQDAQARSDRAGLFLAMDRQLLISWGRAGEEPEVEGDPGLVIEAASPQRVLAFAEWLPDEDARRIDRHLTTLRGEGTGFSEALRTIRGDFIEIEGRPIAGRAVLSIRAVTGERFARARLKDEMAGLEARHAQLVQVVEAIPQPIWLRDRSGQIIWANAAYLRAVEQRSVEESVAAQAEILESDDRAEIRRVEAAGGIYRGTVTAILSGQRRRVDVVDVSGPQGGGGFALDISELEDTRIALERQMEAHVRTLDELPTAVAIFDRRQRLTYANRAFRDLFALDARFVESQPGNVELLDRLRSEGRLPEASDYREWRAQLIAHYALAEGAQYGWNLPNGRALRVVVSPNPQGGVTYLFEDETERFTLATSYDRLKNTQWETLMALSEGVAVFGSDGKLELSNPSFAELWTIEPDLLAASPHVEEVGAASRTGHATIWRDISQIVCGLGDVRVDHHFEVTTSAHRVLAIMTTPLPEGATLVTVTDVTDTVQAEKRLREHNEALRRAARLRTDFIRNVSFELRSPLMSVVGLAQALAEGVAGPLAPKQEAYAQDISRASDALLALTNEIMDLGTIESGEITLERSDVELRKAISEAAEGLKDRLGDAKVRLSVNIASGITSVMADAQRLRHILYNLLANAVSYSRPGDTVRLAVMRERDGVAISVSDTGQGAGVSGLGGGDDVSNAERENGLRYSLARALVQLHGGYIRIADDGEGGNITTVFLPDPAQEAAA